MMTQYLIFVDAHDEAALTQVLNELMLEKGAKAISPGEWILEAGPDQAMAIYEGISAVIGNASVFVKELTGDPSWNNLVVSRDLFFDMLKGEIMPAIEKRLKERA